MRVQSSISGLRRKSAGKLKLLLVRPFIWTKFISSGNSERADDRRIVAGLVLNFILVRFDVGMDPADFTTE